MKPKGKQASDLHSDWAGDELIVVHPVTGEERFLVTDRETIDLRLHHHEHLFDQQGRCLICEQSVQKIEDTQNVADPDASAD